MGAAVRTWPFRVFSFPSEIVSPGLQKGWVMAIRMAEGRYEIPSLPCAPFRIIDSYVRPAGLLGSIDKAMVFSSVLTPASRSRS